MSTEASARQIAEAPSSTRTGTGAASSYLEEAFASGLGILASTTLAGVILLGLGQFDPIVAVAMGVAFGLLMWIPRRPRLSLKLDAPSLALLALVGFWIVANVPYAAEHVIADRDPGVYVSTARWLAGSERLTVDIAPGILDSTSGSFWAWGFHDDRGDGRLTPGFLHGLPVIMATGHGFGGDRGLFVTPIVIGALALVAFFLFSTWFLDRWWAVVATLCLAVSPVHVYFSRDAYTEPLMLLLVFGGLWLLLRAISTSRHGFLAGLVLGSAVAVRIDAWLVLGSIPILAAHVSMLECEPKRDLKVVGHAALGMSLAVGVGLIDLILLSPSYWEVQAQRLIAVWSLLAGIGVVLVLVLTSDVSAYVRRLDPLLPRIAWVSLTVAGCAAAWAFLIRPFGEPARGGITPLVGVLLGREGLSIEADRTMAELSGMWLWWYMGPILILGLLGFLTMLRSSIIDPSPRSTLLLATGIPFALLYLWRPSINPEQLWAMRRFLPVVIPCLILLAVWWIARVVLRFEHHCGRYGLVAVGLVITAMSAARLVPVASTSPLAGAHQVLLRVCEQLPPNAALFSDPVGWARTWSPPLRIFCEVPVVVGPPAELRAAMEKARRTGFDVLWFGSSCLGPVEPVLSVAAGFPVLERTLTRPPTERALVTHQIDAVRPLDGGESCAGGAS